jgi:hypothetical protein
VIVHAATVTRRDSGKLARQAPSTVVVASRELTISPMLPVCALHV